METSQKPSSRKLKIFKDKINAYKQAKVEGLQYFNKMKIKTTRIKWKLK